MTKQHLKGSHSHIHLFLFLNIRLNQKPMIVEIALTFSFLKQVLIRLSTFATAACPAGSINLITILCTRTTPLSNHLEAPALLGGHVALLVTNHRRGHCGFRLGMSISSTAVRSHSAGIA